MIVPTFAGRHARMVLALTVCSVLCVTADAALAQTTPNPVPGGCETPASQRPKDEGCYLSASQELGVLSQSARFWHVYNYPTRAAAEAIKGPHGTVVESFGRTWLYTIADADWRPAKGERVAVVGPLTVKDGVRYTARYMEAVFPPGLATLVHVHSGAEAWYVVSGAQCLETPDSARVVRAGEGGVVPQGPPMRLSSVGAGIRRSVFLVLHETSQPWITYTSAWTPKGRCPK
jgi:mannose-6-phosphate isomerase-like protein (cupin superfamily)